MSLFTIHIHADGKDFDVVLDKLNHLINLTTGVKNTMATQADIDALTAQIAKVNAEVTAAVQALKDEIAALQNQNPALDLTALQASVQALDDLNPDAPVV